MPDKARLAAQLDELGRAIDDLERYARTWSFDDWVTDGDRRRMVLNAAYTAAQACIDIAARLVADIGKDRPEAYRELFPPLAEAGLIDQVTAAQLARWAGLRNVVAHLYWKLHLEEIDGALRADLEPLRTFRVAAARLVAPRRTPTPSTVRDRGPRYRASSTDRAATPPQSSGRGATPSQSSGRAATQAQSSGRGATPSQSSGRGATPSQSSGRGATLALSERQRAEGPSAPASTSAPARKPTAKRLRAEAPRAKAGHKR